MPHTNKTTGKTIKVLSPAKINLHLQLLDKREDGFHNLSSLFHLVSLHDTITVNEISSGQNSELILSGNFSVPQKDNIITKALTLFRETTGYKADLEISVEKKIPEGAGLGGGSSNAAFTLLALERISKISLSPEKAMTICLQLGSDVPFFRKSVAAWVSGRGEIIEPISPLSPLPLLIIHPEIKIATAEAFALYTAKNKIKEGKKDFSPNPSRQSLLKSLRGETNQWPFFNDFTDLLKEPYPVLAHIEDLLYSSGSIFSSLTGSGSAVFGIFTDLVALQRAERAIKKDFSFCYMAELLEKNPFSEI